MTKLHASVASTWLEVDRSGLRKTLERKVKTWAVFELAQNSWDEDGTTEVAITLSKPQNGKSALTCVDNAPKGYEDLTRAHTMFAESYKKSDPTKRGRFNIGEKNVLAICDEARITSTTGQVVFHKNGKRTTNSTKRKAGSEFYGIVDMTDEEWNTINKQVLSGLFPPIPTSYNGVVIPTRKPFRTFEATLPTEIADENGILRARKRKTEIRIYPVKPGEISSIYEKGILVVNIDSKWHIDVQQKIPLNTERDNVTPWYLKTVYAVVLNEMLEFIEERDAAEPWVASAMSTKIVTKEAATKVMTERFGKDRVSYDPSDVGSNKEAVSQDHVVVHGGSMSKGEWATAKRHGTIEPAGHKFPTNFKGEPKEWIQPENFTPDQKRYVKMIETVSPILINHTVKIKIFADDTMASRGCTRWGKTPTETEAGEFIFEINETFHDCSDWDSNYYLLLHELAHHMVKSNDHLSRVFYDTVNKLGAKLAELALNQPELFTKAHVEKIRAVEVNLAEDEVEKETSEVGV